MVHHKKIYDHVPKLDLDVANHAVAMVNLLAHKAGVDKHEFHSHHEAAMAVLQASAMPIMLSAASANDPPPAIPGGDKFDELLAMMGDATKPEKEQVAAGSAPAPVVVNLLPEVSALKTEQLAASKALKGMASLSQLYANILDIAARTKRGHPDRYRVTDPTEAMQAYADQADFAYQAMTGPLAGYFIFSGGSMEHITRKMTRAEFHVDFLKQIFDGFDLSKSTISSLDKILTTFANAVGKISFDDESKTKTVNHVVKVNTVPKVNIGGDDADPTWDTEPTTTLIYMKIDASAWRTSLSKWEGGGTVEGFNFDMFFSSTKCMLNVDAYTASKAKFDKIFTFCTNKNLEEYGEDRTTDVADSNQN